MSDDLFFYPARVNLRAVSETLRAIVPDVDDPYFWQAEISNNRLDSYYSRMHTSTLQNFALDAAAGVSFLDSHDSRKLGFGQSLTGEYQASDVERVLADFYTAPGIRFGGRHSFESTDDFIRAVKARIVRDVSVGFYDGGEICDICGNPVWGWTDCSHFPGNEYPVGEQGAATVLATSSIIDAHLAEVSAVFDGATPGAVITKIDRMLSEGTLGRDRLAGLQQRYRARFPGLDLNKQFRPAYVQRPARTGGKTVDFEKELRTLFPGSKDLLAAVRQAVTDAERLAGEVDELRALADDGRQYRADLVSEALAEGVRANGDTFAQETYRKMLESAELSVIRQMRDDWRKAGDKRFGAGGPQVKPSPQPDDETNNQQPVSVVPDAAYTI